MCGQILSLPSESNDQSETNSNCPAPNYFLPQNIYPVALPPHFSDEIVKKVNAWLISLVKEMVNGAVLTVTLKRDKKGKDYLVSWKGGGYGMQTQI